MRRGPSKYSVVRQRNECWKIWIDGLPKGKAMQIARMLNKECDSEGAYGRGEPHDYYSAERDDTAINICK